MVLEVRSCPQQCTTDALSMTVGVERTAELLHRVPSRPHVGVQPAWDVLHEDLRPNFGHTTVESELVHNIEKRA